MIDLEKHKVLMATAMLPLVFGIASCSSNRNSEDRVVENEAQSRMVEDETTVAGYMTTCPDCGDRYSYNAPIDGGRYTEQVPYNALNRRYGNAGEDLATTVPGGSASDVVVTDEVADCMDDKFEILTDEKIAADNAAGNDAGNGRVVAANVVATEGSGQAEQIERIAIVDDTTVMANLRGAEEGKIDNMDPVQDWLAPEGASLRALLMEWSDRSNWKVVWKSDREYVLEAGAVFRGRYMDVASALVRTFARARPAPIATFYKGNMVLLITTLEDENAD